MNKEEQKLYMSLSNDPNERGRLWKEIRNQKKPTEMMELYNELFIKNLKKRLNETL